jgi:hypothetical protein
VKQVARLIFNEFLEEINSMSQFEEGPGKSGETVEEEFSQIKFQTVTAFIQGSLLCISEVMQAVMGEVITQYTLDPSQTNEE